VWACEGKDSGQVMHRTPVAFLAVLLAKDVLCRGPQALLRSVAPALRITR